MKQIPSQELIKKFKLRLKSITPLQAFGLLVVVIGVVFLVKFFGLGEEWKTVRIEVVGKPWSEDWSGGYLAFKPKAWLARNIQVGDVELGVDGKKIAEIMETEEYGDYKPALYITANLKVIYNRRTKKYAFKNKSIETGTTIEILLPETRIEGQIVDMNAPQGSYEKKTMTITGRMRNVDPWLLEKISVGDMMINKATGETVAEIVNINTEPGVSAVFFTNPNVHTNVFLDILERRRNVIIDMKIEMKKFSEGWRFAGKQIVKVGSTIALSLPEYEIGWLEIQNIQDGI